MHNCERDPNEVEQDTGEESETFLEDEELEDEDAEDGDFDDDNDDSDDEE